MRGALLMAAIAGLLVPQASATSEPRKHYPLPKPLSLGSEDARIKAAQAKRDRKAAKRRAQTRNKETTP